MSDNWEKLFINTIDIPAEQHLEIEDLIESLGFRVWCGRGIKDNIPIACSYIVGDYSKDPRIALPDFLVRILDGIQRFD